MLERSSPIPEIFPTIQSAVAYDFTAALLGLERQGVAAARLARVAAPVGLDIGAETIGEIAVAILAEIIQQRRGGTGRPLSRRE